MKKEKPLIVLTGPTASGKSSLGIQLAKALDGEIISADSMQIYKKMNIGTAKTMPDQQEGIPHHLQDIIEPSETFSVAEYAELTKKTIDFIHSKGKVPIMVGGTGLYIQAVIDNIQFFDLKNDIKLRENLISYGQTHGNQALWEKLSQVDPVLAQKLHPNNQGRIIRGIEVYATSGKPLSYWQEESRKTPSPYHIMLLGLAYHNRSELYHRINQRVEEMIEEGLLEEMKSLSKENCSLTAQQAIGYKELWNVLEDPQALPESIAQLQQNTRNYAKRQLTWMRGRPELHWIYRDDYQFGHELLADTIQLITEWDIT